MSDRLSRSARRDYRRWSLLPLAFCLLTAPVAPAVSDAPDKSEIRNPQSEIAVPRMELPQPEHEIGVAEPGGRLDFVFPVRNTGTAPLKIEAQSSCGCMVTSFEKEIAPGQTGQVKVALNTVRLRGEIAKHVTLQTNDPDNPSAILTIHGRFVDPLTFEPGQEIAIPIQQGMMALREVHILCNGPAPLTIEKVESSAPFLQARLVGVPTPEAAVAATGRSSVTLHLIVAEPPSDRFTESVTLTTNDARFPQITLTVKGHPEGEHIVPPRVRIRDFESSAAALREPPSPLDRARQMVAARLGTAAAGRLPGGTAREPRRDTGREEAAALMDQIAVLKAVRRLRLSEEQVAALLVALKPAVETLERQDAEGVRQIEIALPLLRRAANPSRATPFMITAAELEYSRVQETTRQTRERTREQVRKEVRAALEKLLTPPQRALVLAAGTPSAAPQNGAAPRADFDTFITRVLLTPAAVAVLESTQTAPATPRTAQAGSLR